VNNFHSGDGNHSAKNPPLAATLVCWQATLVHQGGKQPGDPAGDRTAPDEGPPPRLTVPHFQRRPSPVPD